MVPYDRPDVISYYSPLKLCLYLATFFMAALCNRAGHIYFHPVICSSSIFFLSSLNLSGWRLDVCHTSTHGVALVRI